MAAAAYSEMMSLKMIYVYGTHSASTFPHKIEKSVLAVSDFNSVARLKKIRGATCTGN